MSDAKHVEIPLSRLSDDALIGIIDNFILREGTDYGHADVPLALKRSQVLAQLQAGEAVIVFDPVTESTTILQR